MGSSAHCSRGQFRINGSAMRQRYGYKTARSWVKSHGHQERNQGRDPRLNKVMDPCVGTGRMLLHASNYSYCLYGCDIDPLVASISRINSCCYAPWMAFPFSESILGVSLPPPPPAPLPIPAEHQPADDAPLFRCDDRGQGLLF